MKRFPIWILLVALCACAAPKTSKEATPGFRALGEPVAVETVYSDETIGLEARRRVDMTGASEMAGVRIHVEAGVVTLRGSVPNRAAAWRAEGAARSVPGVKSVVNELLVAATGRP